MPNWKTAVGRVRLSGMIEGVSFLLLTCVAMPLKYFAGMPEAVKAAGWCHGGFFILYGMVVFSAWSGGKLSFSKSLMAFIASLIPFGPFLVDGKLLEDDRSVEEWIRGILRRIAEGCAAALMLIGAILLVLNFFPLMNPVQDELNNRGIVTTMGQYIVGAAIALFVLGTAWAFNLLAKWIRPKDDEPSCDEQG